MLVYHRVPGDYSKSDASSSPRPEAHSYTAEWIFLYYGRSLLSALVTLSHRVTTENDVLMTTSFTSELLSKQEERTMSHDLLQSSLV